MKQSEHTLTELVSQYLRRQLPEAGAHIEAALAEFAAHPERAAFFRLFALAPRWTGRQAATPEPAECAALSALHPNLGVGSWDDDQLARLWILVVAQQHWPAQRFAVELDTLFNTADTAELVALYRSLAILENPQQFHARAREGARSNMVPVFLAVAHYNNYPTEYFDEDGWNQLVLKAIFNACPLDPITGLEQRNNPALAHMLCDYVRERWAASRSVPWDIWRCIGPHADTGEDLALLPRALVSQERLTRFAAALALRDCGTPAALEILRGEQATIKATEEMNWQDLAVLDQGG